MFNVAVALEEEEPGVAIVVTETFACDVGVTKELSLQVLPSIGSPLFAEVVLFISLVLENITAPSASTVTFSWT